MRVPLFSVVIPTKNRSFLVRQNLESLLNQSFTDFEVIVCDNDDTDATAQVAASFKDSRLIHHRTGGLSMNDNWESGCAAAQGEYVMVLEDKQALKSHALETIHAQIEKNHPETIRWHSDAFEDDFQPPRLRKFNRIGEPKWIGSDHLLNLFLSDLESNYKTALPLPQYSAIHRKLLERIKSGPMGRLFHPVALDVNLGILQLNYAEGIMELQEALVVYLSTVHSNGRSLSLKGALGKQFIDELGGDTSVFFDRVPIKTMAGFIYNDYMHMQERVGGRLKNHPVCWDKFFLECFKYIRQCQELGVDMAEELQIWSRSYSQLEASIRTRVEAAIQAAYGTSVEEASANKIPKHKYRLSKRMERWAKYVLRGLVLKRPEWRFQNAMEYIRFEQEKRTGKK